MHAEFVRRQAEEETYYAQQELLQKTEAQRRNVLAQEEEKLTEQRAKLAAMKRELKVKELQLLEASRRRFLKHQQEMKASQIKTLDKEISRKMELRDQETAAAIQDLEVRQMELEAQRRRLEEHLLKEQDQSERRVSDEVATRLRKAERENESLAQQLHKPSTGIQEHAVSLANACQQDASLSRQRAVLERLELVEAEQIKQRERLTEIHWETEEEERRLTNTMREVAGKKWEEVMNSRAQFTEQHKPISAGKTGSHTDGSSHSSNKLSHTLNGTSEVNLPSTSIACMTQKHSSAATPRQQGAALVCLNSSSPTESTSTKFSLDRSRTQLDNSERELLKEIRELRQKLVTRTKEGSSLSSQSVHTLSSSVSQ